MDVVSLSYDTEPAQQPDMRFSAILRDPETSRVESCVLCPIGNGFLQPPMGSRALE